MDITHYKVGGKKYKNINDLAPQWPFRLAMIGPTGCGKTNSLMNLIKKYLYYDRLYVFIKTLHEDDYYIDLQECFDKIHDALKYQVAHFYDDLEKLDLKMFDKSLQNLIVIDDFQLREDQKDVIDLFIYGRKLNCSVILLTHSYFDIPKIIRMQCNYFVVFQIPSNKELRQIIDDQAIGKTYEEIKTVYDKLKKYEFLLIDRKSDDDKLKIRINFSAS